MIVAGLQIIAQAVLNGHKQINRRLPLERLRQHADNGEALIVERDRLPDDVWIAAEAALPQPLTDDHCATCARLIFFGREVAPQRGRDAERGEETGRAFARAQPFRAAPAGPDVPAAPKRRQPLEDRASTAPGWVVRIRDRHA